ncbi:MAG: hypothetical protein KDB77_06405 [Flavobacteriales bacterium]|nr:hypothetical protein [Flavobacteriales bacterium]
MSDVNDRDTGKTNTSSRTKRVVQLGLLLGTLRGTFRYLLISGTRT